MDQSQAATMDRAVRAAEQRVAQLQSQKRSPPAAGQRPSGSGRQSLDPARMRRLQSVLPLHIEARATRATVDRNYKLVSTSCSPARRDRHARLSISTAGPPLYWYLTDLQRPCCA